MPDPSDANRTAAATPDPSAAPWFGPPAQAGEVGTLGPYRVLKELGKGGMGAVYLAIDTRLGRKLALKVMLPEFAANRGAKERFLREARAAAQITHDHVVTVYEADERDGVPYIAMQFLQGRPLNDYLKHGGPPPLAHVVRIGREAALGLAAAHEQGLIHRDIKPANLWIEAPSGRVKVLDFGLARPVAAETELTKSGAVVGTPAFMSPEQARGLRVDHRTDLWSLGAVLYRLCTGQNPFRGPNVMAVLMALGTEEPTPVRELNPAVPEPLAALVHRLLSKRPEHRPQSAAEVAELLPAALAPPLPVVVHPVPAPPDDAFAHLLDASGTEASASAAEPVPPPKRAGRRWPLAAAGAAVLAVAVGAVIATRGKSGDPNGPAPAPPSPVAPVPAPKAEAEAWKPLPPWKPVPVGESPFDRLSANEIPMGEWFIERPKEVVAVIGTHARRHPAPVTAAAVSADGKWAATRAGEWGRAGVIVWDAATGALRSRLEVPADDGSLHYAPDGRLIDFSRGTLTVFRLSGPVTTSDVNKIGARPGGAGEYDWDRAALCENGRTLVAFGKDAQFGLFDLTGVRPVLVGSFARKTGDDSRVLVAEAASVLIYTEPDGRVRRAAIRDGALAGHEELALPVPKTGFAAISPDGTRLAGVGEGRVQVWDIAARPPKLAYQIDAAAVGGPEFVPGPDARLVFSADNRWLASSAQTANLFRVDGAQPTLVRQLRQRGTAENGVAAFGGGRAVVGDSDGLVRLWNLGGPAPAEVAPFDPTTAFVGLDYGGHRPLGPTRWQVTLRRTDGPNLFQVWSCDGTRPAPAGYSFNEAEARPVAGGRWAAGGHGSPARVFGFAAGVQRAESIPEVADGPVATSPEGTLLVRRTQKNVLEAFDISGPKPVPKWSLPLTEHPPAPGTGVVVSAGGRWLTYHTGDWHKGARLTIWRISGSRPELFATVPTRASGFVLGHEPAGDARTLFYQPDTTTVAALDLTGGEPRAVWERRLNTPIVKFLAAHPGGGPLAVAHARGAVLLDPATGAERWSWAAPGAVGGVAWAHDGRHLLLYTSRTVYVLRLNDLVR